jgi:histidinol dehydrogenase
VRIERFRLEDPQALVGQVRALIPAGESVALAVAAIVDDVRERGDAAVLEYTERFDAPGQALRVGPDELAAALAALDPEVRQGLEVAISNVAEVANAGVGDDREVALAQGHRVLLREVAVRSAAVYVPGGAAPYPSTVVMGVVTARAAGVEEVVVCSPPPIAPVLLGTCALCGIGTVYRMGGAQAVAALAYGTDSVGAVDVIVGPGNLYVQEAKRLVSGQVGIDGFAGPSDLLVIFDADDLGSLRLIALDLLAQAEHGAQSLVLAVSDDPGLLNRLADELSALAELRPRSDACWSRPRRSRRRWRSRTPTRPSTSSWSGRGRRRWPSGCAAPGRSSSAGRGRRRSATTSPGPTTSCRRAGRPASRLRSRRATSAGGWPRSGSPRARSPGSRGPARRSPWRRASRSTRSRCSPGHPSCGTLSR